MSQKWLLGLDAQDNFNQKWKEGTGKCGDRIQTQMWGMELKKEHGISPRLLTATYFLRRARLILTVWLGLKPKPKQPGWKWEAEDRGAYEKH